MRRWNKILENESRLETSLYIVVLILKIGKTEWKMWRPFSLVNKKHKIYDL